MNDEKELNRLTKENDNFRKIIETQQNTINRMIDYFILGQRGANLNKKLPQKGMMRIILFLFVFIYLFYSQCYNTIYKTTIFHTSI